MKILFLVARDRRHPLAAGGDRHMGDLAELLAEEGHSVEMLVASSPDLPPVERVRGVTIHRVAPPRLLAPVIWSRLILGEANRFDLVLEEVIGGERTPFFAPLLTRVPCVGFWYQDNRPLFRAAYPGWMANLAGGLQRIVLHVHRGRSLITISHKSRDWLESQGFPRERIALCSPRVDLGHSESGIPPYSQRRHEFITVGNIRPLKRFEEAIEVLRELRRVIPDARLTILGRSGDPAYLAHLRALARERGLEPEVTFATDTTEAEKYGAFDRSLALTIHSPVEGFGWTIPEAGLRGVPAVGNPGTPKDVLRDGTNGVCVPFGDVQAYVRVLARWMTEPGEWEEYSRGASTVAREYATSGLTPEVNALLRDAFQAQTTSPGRGVGGGRQGGAPIPSSKPGDRELKPTNPLLGSSPADSGGERPTCGEGAPPTNQERPYSPARVAPRPASREG